MKTMKLINYHNIMRTDSDGKKWPRGFVVKGVFPEDLAYLGALITTFAGRPPPPSTPST